MNNSATINAVRLAFIGALQLGGCSGNGGGPAPTVAVPTATTATPTPTYCADCVGPPSIGAAYATGVAAGPIAAPGPASFGTAPAQTPTAFSPTFDNSSGSIPVNVTFPAIVTSLKAESAGMSAVSSPGASITMLNTLGDATNYQIVIPSLNVNARLADREYVTDPNGWIANYSYVEMGVWGLGRGVAGPLQTASVFSFGYDTPSSAIPTSGSAQFAGLTSAIVFTSNNGMVIETTVGGKAVVSVNFNSGQVTGALTSMSQWDGLSAPGGNIPWNDVTLNAKLTAGTNTFSGTTAVTSAPGTAFSLKSSATGYIDGALYGPAAQNVGAVWSLNDGSKSVLGYLGGQTGK